MYNCFLLDIIVNKGMGYKWYVFEDKYIKILIIVWGYFFFFVFCYMWYKNYKEIGDVIIKKRMMWILVIWEYKWC